MIVESEHCIAVPPGETIKEQLEDRNISMKEFTRRMGVSEKFIADLLEGDVALTESVAAKLEGVFGIPSQFWNNLEGIYRADLEKANEENRRNREKGKRRIHGSASANWGAVAMASRS